MKLLYFAWVRQKIGKGSEILDLPDHILTVSDLLDYLPSLGQNYADALAKRDLLKIAIDEEFASLDDEIKGANTIAIFPPVTGG